MLQAIRLKPFKNIIYKLATYLVLDAFSSSEISLDDLGHLGVVFGLFWSVFKDVGKLRFLTSVYDYYYYYYYYSYYYYYYCYYFYYYYYCYTSPTATIHLCGSAALAVRPENIFKKCTRLVQS